MRLSSDWGMACLQGTTGRCATFANPPLCGEGGDGGGEEGGGVGFECRAVECWLVDLS